MTVSDISLPRIYERDIDVLVREELLFNDAVQSLFKDKLKLPPHLQFGKCRLSVSDQSGETDIEAQIFVEGIEGAILIENKIDAAFQPLQPERYKLRATALADKLSGKILCVLIAPAHYDVSEASELFDAVITYEELGLAIAAQGTNRAEDRANLIQHAINLARKSYVQVPSEDVTALWTRIYEIACANYPALKMKPPGKKGSGSMWLLFKADLPPNISIDWKITKAVVDLSFWPSATHKPIDGLDLTELGASADKSGNTVLIRIPVSNPPINWSGLSDDQIHDALTTACNLLTFYKANPSSFA